MADSGKTEVPQVAGPPLPPQSESESNSQSKQQPTAPPQSTQSTTSSTNPKPIHKPFPSVIGSCICSKIRYRLLTSPLFVYACHCTDCQKTTGSAFGLFLTIETSNIALLTPTQPSITVQWKSAGSNGRAVTCPTCEVQLWAASWLGTRAGVDGAVADVHVGTLDFAGLFEPDVHSFVESKVGWLRLPEGARTTERDFDYTKLWPKQSLKRLETCLRIAKEAQARRMEGAKELAQAHVPGAVTLGRGDEKAAVPVKSGVVVGVGDASVDDGAGDGEKTPTAVEFVDEDDEAFEKRYRETERALQARLENLRLKLDEEQGKKQKDLEWLTKNLELEDKKGGHGEGKI